MAIQNEAALVEALVLEMGEVAESLSDEQQTRAAKAALSELGWAYPTTDAQDYWLIKRAVRHGIFMLLTVAARKFKYDNINLHQRFEHYKALVEMMDSEFGKAVERNQILFSNINPATLFGEVIPAGFVYGNWGEDLTYSQE